MKIASKISLSILAVALILTITAGTISYLIAKDNLRKSIDNNLATACCFRADHIKTYIEMLEISVGQLAESVVLRDLLEIINIAGRESISYDKYFEIAMTRLKRTKAANPAIYEFLLIDATGKVVASSNESSIGSDKSKDDFFLGGQKGIYFKDVYYSELFKEPLIAVSAPFLNNNTGEFLGVLAARVKLTDLNNIATSEIGMGKTGEIYLVNKQGIRITPSRFKEDVVLKQKVDTENVRQAWLNKDAAHILLEKTLVYVFSDYRGVQVLGAHEYIPRTQWAVLAEIDTKEAFAPLTKLHSIFLVTLFIVPIIAWLLGTFVAGLITGPLHNLHKGTEIIGSGNLDYKVGRNTKDEVGQLSRAFDEMTRNLRKSRDELKNWGETLEAKVDARTKELTDAQEATLNILEDLTAAKKKVEETMKVKSDFTSMVSHELRTPLTAIKEGIAIVLDGSTGTVNEEQREFLDLAKRNVDRLARLINDVLDFQKLEAGSMAFNIQENDINATVSDVHHMMLPSAQKKGLDLVLKIGEDLPAIRFDKDKTTQVLMNLVNNAVKFTDKGKVTIMTSKGENFIQVAVRDSGVGIKEGDLPKLFQKFVQLGDSNNRKTGGSGLGLAISKEIIEKQRGKIWAESKPGEGTTFYFLLPIRERRV